MLGGVNTPRRSCKQHLVVPSSKSREALNYEPSSDAVPCSSSSTFPTILDVFFFSLHLYCSSCSALNPQATFSAMSSQSHKKSNADSRGPFPTSQYFTSCLSYPRPLQHSPSNHRGNLSSSCTGQSTTRSSATHRCRRCSRRHPTH